MSWRPGIDLLNTKWPDSNDQQADRTRNPARTMRSAPQPSSFTGWGSHCVNDFFPPDFINPITPTHGLSQQPQGPYRRGNLFSHEIVPEYYSTGVNDDMNQQLMSSGDSLVDGIPTSNGVSLDNSMGPGTIENHARRNNQGRPISSPRGKTRDQNGELKCRWEGCPYRGGFSREWLLERHVRSQHIYPEQFHCHVCLKRFKRKDNCSTHVRLNHENSA